MTKNLKITFWALVIAFLGILGQFFIPGIQDLLSGSVLFLAPFIVFSLLGLALIFFTIKAKLTGPLKKFLLLTGISSAGFFVGVFLHNFFYALAMLTSQIIVLGFVMGFLSAAFFIIAILGCPLGFLVGVVVSIVLLKKGK